MGFGMLVHCSIRETLPASMRSKEPIKINPIASMSVIKGRPALQLLCVVGALMSIQDKFFQTLFVYFAQERFGMQRTAIAWMMSVHGLVGAINQGVVVQIVVRVVSDFFILSLGTLLAAIANMMLFMANGISVVWGSTVIRSIADSSYGPVLYSIASKTADASEVGKVLSALKTITITGDVAGSQMSGMIYHQMGTPQKMPFVYLIAGGFAVASMFMSIPLHQHRQRPQKVKVRGAGLA